MVWGIEGYELVADAGYREVGQLVSARDTATGAEVAITYLAPDVVATPGFLVRYRGEIAVLGLIEYPHLANVYELVEHGEDAAVVTELVDGVSLRDILEETGPLEPEAALFVVECVLAGVREVHGRGIVHRGLNPESILIDHAGTVKVADVGLAAPGRGRRMPANAVYAARELWLGEEPTQTSDIFAATALLYECLSGQPPLGTGGYYLGGSGQPADDAIAALPPDHAPRQLRVFMAHGLAADPMERLATARTAMDQLDVVATVAFGPGWRDTGKARLQRRMAGLLAERAPSPGHAESHADPYADPYADRYPDRYEEPQVESYAEAYAFAEAPGARPEPGRPGWTSGGPPEWPPARDPAWDAEPVPEPEEPPHRQSERAWLLPDGNSHRAKTSRVSRLLVAAGISIMLAAGTAFALTAMSGSDGGSPDTTTTNSHQALVSAGPTVPSHTSGPEADTVKPTAPAGLRVTGRSVTAVSIDWAEATDNVKIAGYLVLRDGNRVGTTYTPGFTDSGLTGKTTYQYAVVAFDDGGNMSATSQPVTATTLEEPDVAPPSVPTNLRSTGASTNSIVLVWSAARDNVGVAGYEVFRDGQLVANVPRPGYTDTGLGAATSHTYRVRAFDTANNASADSNQITAATLAAPDTSAPTVPTGLTATATSTSTIAVSWNASTDNVGVTGYRVFRDGSQVAQVAGTTFTDQGLAAGTSYHYSVRAVDAAGNQSGPSGSVVESTPVPPTTPPPTPDPTPDPEIVSVTLAVSMTGCEVTVEITVVADGPLNATLSYTVTGLGSDSVPLSFTTGDLTETRVLTADGTVDGQATGSAGGKSDSGTWVACPTTPPSTTAT